MPELHLTLLGGLSISLDSRPLTSLVSQKAEVLLAYLCMERREHNREILATLLWENSAQEQGLANLRTLLASLKKHIDSHLQITRQTVAIHPQSALRVDAFDLRDALQRLLPEPTRHFEQLQDALTLYQGEFLHGIYPRDSRELEEWITLTRTQLLQLALTGHHTLGVTCLDTGNYTRGIPHAQSLLRLDPVNESYHRLMMNLLARSGQREAALSQYENCVRFLDEELGQPPESETVALAERLRQSVQSSLPTPGTSFVGRQLELAKIAENLRQPECRLLTILGLGGSGKTRLALQAARLLQSEFANGSVFAPLHGIDHASYLTSAIAESVQLPLHTNAPTHEQLSRFLHKKELLLVLDNCEHLLAGDSAAIFRQTLQTLLKGAPSIRFLLTSRERVGLQSEWLLELDGLDVSADDLAPAYQLFIQRARAVSASRDLNAEDQAAIHRICQIVQGLPLGIELAAAWTRSLASPQIAAILETNLDLLSSRLHDVPERQRSMRAVFDYVWERLDVPAQTLAARLGVFASSFDLDAAIGITQASPWLIAELVEKSFLHLENGRYRMIEALQTYALEKLKQTPSLHSQTLGEYSSYYFGLLHRFRFAPQNLRADMDNLRAAWLMAVQQARYDLIQQASDDFCHLYIQRGMFQEGRQLFQSAIAALEGRENDFPMALSGLSASLGEIASDAGDYIAAQRILTDAVAQAKALHAADKINAASLALCRALSALGGLNWRLGKQAEAQAAFQESLVLARSLGDLTRELFALNGMAVVLSSQGNLTEAKQLFTEIHARAISAGNLERAMRALNNLGEVHKTWQDYATSRQYYQQALTLAHEIGAQQSIALFLLNLADADIKLGQLNAARTGLRDALELAQRLGALPWVVSAVKNFGFLLYAQGQPQRGMALLGIARIQPAWSSDHQRDVERTLTAWGLDSEMAEAQMQKGETLNWDATIQELLQK